MSRRRKQAKEGASAPSLVQIQITKKRVTGDEGVQYVMDQRLQVGDEISPETARLFVDKGLAIEISGKLQSDIAKERGEAAAKNNTVLQKQRAETEMARFDMMDEEDRQRLREHNPDEGDDVIDG